MMALTIGGRLGADPETRQAGGNTVTNFRVAVSGYDTRAKEKTTTWVRVAVWGKRGEQLAGFLSKGDGVIATGTMSLSQYENKEGVLVTTVELNASDLSPIGGGKKEDEPAPRRQAPSRGKAPAAASDFPDDEIPF